MGQLPYFRTEEFSKINLECAERLKRLAGAPEDSHVFFLTCSGTGAMEAVVGGCFAAGDRLLAINGGGFGRRFCEMAVFHGIPTGSVDLAFGEALGPEKLETAIESRESTQINNIGAADARFTGLLVNLHETTTGQLYYKDVLAGFCRANRLFFVVDAIGSFLADPLDFEKDGVDALIISSQKALALPPGLSALILSDRLYEKVSGRVSVGQGAAGQGVRPFSLYLDLAEAEANAARGQTPFTPAIGLLLALRERLERLEAEGGAEAAVARTKALAEDFRSRIEKLQKRKDTSPGKTTLALPDYPLSNACTPLVFPEGGAKAVYEKLASEHGVWLNPNGGPLADTVLRVGHLGNLTEKDNALLAGLLTDILT